ncbi:MAG: hypothetical protein JSS13_03115 [Proteobacteria bacterium]|nr:hypothetical protein [Pseudomonadota bacterium]
MNFPTRNIALILSSTLFAGTALAGNAMWTSEGPFGGSVYRLYVSPTSPSVLYAGSRGGIFRSNDGGVSWTRKEAGLAGSVAYTYALGMDADAPGTLWVVDGFGHFDRSTDGGDNWAQTGYNLSSNDLANDIADVPGGTGTLYIATALNGVLKSSNSGSSFLPVNSGLPANVPINRVAVDPANSLRVIAGVGYANLIDPLHQQSIYVSSDGGTTWNGTLALNDGVNPYYGQVSDVSFGAGTTVYAVVDQQLYRSGDDGATWAATSLPTYTVLSIQADATDANTVLIGGYAGLMRSTDGGDSATALNSGLSFSVGAPVAVNRIVLHPNYPATPQIWLGTVDAGIYFSANSGTTWAVQNDGLAAINIRALAMFHDASTHRMFAGYGDAFTPSPALYRGNNSGPGTPFTSWAPSNTNLGAYQIRSVTIDPTTKSGGIGSARIYATGRSGIGHAGALDARNGGIYRSSDGGNTWSTTDSGLPTSGNPPAPNVGTVRSLVLDPRSCASPPPSGPCASGPLQTVYATSNGRSVAGTAQFRIMKSINGGNSWTTSDSGIPQPFNGSAPDYLDYQIPLVVPIVINPANPQVLFVGTNLTYDPSVVATPTIQNGVYKSIDGGATWTFSSNGLPIRAGTTATAFDVLSLAINPANPNELWCSVIDGAASVNAGGIYHTVDSGANWSDASTGITSADIRALYVDPTNPAIVYAAGGGTAGNPGGVYKTTDSGAHWLSISVGLPADAALALQVDPVDSSVLYAGTNSGVWTITQMVDSDGDGVPDAMENNAPNGGDGNNDGIPDAAESAVGSLATASGGRPDGGTGARTEATPYFTVVASPVTGTCTQTVDVQSVYAAYHGNDVSTYGDNYAYPRQLARFEILDCQKATVTVKFHGANFGNGYSMRFYGPSTPGDPATMGWYDFSARAAKIAADTWQLTLDNGQFGSYRPASANSILFEGGPAYEEGIFRNGFN